MIIPFVWNESGTIGIMPFLWKVSTPKSVTPKKGTCIHFSLLAMVQFYKFMHVQTFVIILLLLFFFCRHFFFVIQMFKLLKVFIFILCRILLVVSAFGRPGKSAVYINNNNKYNKWIINYFCTKQIRYKFIRSTLCSGIQKTLATYSILFHFIIRRSSSSLCGYFW